MISFVSFGLVFSSLTENSERTENAEYLKEVKLPYQKKGKCEWEQRKQRKRLNDDLWKPRDWNTTSASTFCSTGGEQAAADKNTARYWLTGQETTKLPNKNIR